MKRKIKIVWSSTRLARARWFFGVLGHYERRGSRVDGVVISVRGTLAWLAAAAGPCYLAGAAALLWFWHSNPYSTFTYADALLYPVRRAEIAERNGQAFLAQGEDLFHAGKYHQAASLLRFGLARYPQGIRGRILLARYYLLVNQPPAALRVLDQGLTTESPGRPYLETFFDLASQAEDYGRVARTCDRYLQRPVDDATRRWLLERKFNALSASERWDDALAMVAGELPGNMAGEHRVLALLALQRPVEALAFLQSWSVTAGADLGVTTRLRIRALRESGRFEEMDGAILEFRGRSPTEPAPAVFGVVQEALAGREAAAARALEDYIFRFGFTPENLLLVAQPLAEMGGPSLLQRCVSAAAERGYPLGRFQVLLVRCFLQHREWEAAAAALEALPMEEGRDAATRIPERDWLQHLVAAVRLPTNTAQRGLLDFLRGRAWDVGVVRTCSEALAGADRLETARELLALALNRFPASVWLQAKAREIGAEIAAQRSADRGNPAGD